MDLHLLVMSGGRERTLDQFRQLLGPAGWSLDTVAALPGGQSVLSARAAAAQPGRVRFQPGPQ
jgi:hypothetical protein